MIRRTLRGLLGPQGVGYWAPSARQRRSLGQGTRMQAVSQEKFQARHAKFKVQQQANLARHEREQSYRRVERHCSSMVDDALSQRASGGVTAHQRTESMAMAREMLQLGEHARKTRTRNRSFATDEIRSRRDEYSRRRR